MIKFEKIYIEGFRTMASPLEFDFDKPGLNLVKGSNGAGKTTLFEALIWCLYGANLKDTTSDKIATWPEKRTSAFRGTSVQLEVAICDVKYIIARNRKYKGDIQGLQGNDKLMIFREIDGQYSLQGEDLHVKDTQVTIESMLGVDARTFTNSILFGQRMAKLIETDNSDKRKLFEELFDTYWVDDMKARISEARAENDEQLPELEAQSVGLNQKLYGKQDLRDNIIATKESWQAEHDKRVEDAYVSWVDEDSIYKEYKAKLEEKKKLSKDFDEEEYKKIDKQFSEAEEALFKAEENVQNAAAALTINKDNISAAEEDVIEYGNKVAEEVDRVRKDSEKYETELADMKERAATFAKDLKSMEKAGPENAEPCEMCGQPIKDEYSYRSLIQIKKEQYVAYVKEYEKAKGTPEPKGSIEVYEELVHKAEEELKTLKAETTKLEKVKEDAAGALTKANEVFHPLKEAIVPWDKKKNEWEELKTSIISGEAILLQKETAANKAKTILEKVRKEDKPAFDEQLKEVQDALDEIDKERGQVDAAVTELNKVGGMYDWWIKKVLSSSGLKSYIFKAMLGQLNQFTRKYGQRLGVSMEFSIDLTKASKPFKTVCSLGNIQDKEYKEFSGGEKQRLDIVLVFAMHDLISQGSDMNVLIMDEIFEGLDEEGEAAVFDLIRMKSEEGRSVYVISHSQVLDSLYSNTINVTTNSGGSTIIQ